VPAGDNVVLCGEDFRNGDFVAGRGSIISSPLAAVLAGQGISQVPVFRTVKVGFICTGEELLDPAEEFQANKIYNSILYGLHARCSELGAQSVHWGSVPDDAEVIAARMNHGLESVDLLVTTGGVSVGQTDKVEASLQLAGASLLFHGIAMKPGSPTLAASKDGKLIIGLSGNPAAALVTFELIVVPVIKKLMGLPQVLPPKIHGIMAGAFNKPSPQRRFLRAELCREGGRDMIRLTGEQANSVLRSMIGCNVLVDLPAGSGPVTSGQPVTGWLIGNFS
jgi:molybdopterin molybdotransferase